MITKIEIKKSQKNNRWYGVVKNDFTTQFINLELAMLILGISYTDVKEMTYILEAKGVEI